MRKIIHIDMDCFYAAIEIRDNPKLKHKPVAVGGAVSKRGVLCTCNYEARKHGIHSAMPTAQALKLCPQLILLSVSMDKYRDASDEIRKIFHHYTDLVEPLSLDEAYLDVSDCAEYQGSATWIAKAIRQEIVQTQGLTASAGVAPNKFLAKIASDWNKPNGMLTITPNQVDDFVATLPVTKILGVGKVMTEKLHNLNIHTCADLNKFGLHELVKRFGKQGARLYELSSGMDHRKVNPNRVRKSVSVERTYPEDLKQLEYCLQQIPVLLEKLNTRLSASNNRSIHKQFIKIKFFDFTYTTVECISHTLDSTVYEKLLQEGFMRHNKAVRLLGLGVRFPEVDNENLELFQ